jgi:cell division protein ZipA
MQADILRLILFIAGLAVVLGIYLWDRRKRVNLRMRELRDREAQLHHRPVGVAAGQTTSWSDDSDTLDIEQELRELDELLHEERGDRTSGRSAQAKPDSKRGKGDLFGLRASARRSPEKPPEPEPPIKILQINLVAKGAYFEGKDILRAADETGMEAGEMQIFHRFRQGGGGEALFSMASLVEPGFFPLEDMSGFSTPGLTLFAKLPGPMDGIAVFADMLFTAERLAAILDGELQDETHSALTKQTVEHIREDILEHRRHVQLLRKQR